MAFDVVFTLRDAYSRTTTRRMTNTEADMADAVTDTATMLGYLEDLSGCAVVKTDICKVTTYSTSPEAGSNLDAGGTIHARLNNGKLAPVRIPAIDPDMVNADGSVKLGETAVTNLETALGSGGHWTISEGNTVTNFESGELDR
jgi:hypothetical protein